MPEKNLLFYGDNLEIMRKLKKHSVDLIYLDPPFKSEQNYNLIYKTLTGRPVPEQAEAFCDTWDLDPHKQRLVNTMPMLMKEHGVEDYYVRFWKLWMEALKHTQPHLLAYLIYMVERLLHMKSILKPTGSIYLHCDPAASHYIKVMMDGIFGHHHFQNEIIWKRTSGHSDARRYGRAHDVLLYYALGDSPTWNQVYQEYDPQYVEQYYRYTDPDGRRFMSGDLGAAGLQGGGYDYEWKGVRRIWRVPIDSMERLDGQGRIYYTRNGIPRIKRYLDEMPGLPAQDIWPDVQALRSWHKERLGYPTQKPIALLDRIIRASSNPGGVVFDPFCGCGTTIYAAHLAGRQWIGCDIAILAVRIIEEQLVHQYGLVPGEHFEVDGIPHSVDGAKTLWNRDRFQFEHWAVERVGGFPTKKTADKGIDGRIYFELQGDLGVMVLSVKGGKTAPRDVRDLGGVLATEPGAKLAGFITLNEPSRGMTSAAASAGTWEYRGIEYPRIQILTVREIVEERKQFIMPTTVRTRSETGQFHLHLAI